MTKTDLENELVGSYIMIFKIITEKSDWDEEINSMEESDVYFTFEYCKAVVTVKSKCTVFARLK